MMVGMAVETTVDSKEASAVASTSAAVTARRLAGSNRGGGEDADMSAAESHNPLPGVCDSLTRHEEAGPPDGLSAGGSRRGRAGGGARRPGRGPDARGPAGRQGVRPRG